MHFNLFVIPVLTLMLNAVNSAFLHKNDFQRALGSVKNSLSQDYLRSLSIYKRELQLLGFYPIVINNDGLEYVSVEPYFIDNDYDDSLYDMLKKKRKAKKAQEEFQKKQLKKLKKGGHLGKITQLPPLAYRWPLPPPIQQNQDIYPIEQTDDDHDSEEDSEDDKEDQKYRKNNHKTNFEQKSFVTNDAYGHNKFAPRENPTPVISKTSTTSMTTPQSVTTVFPNLDRETIQEVLEQQEIVNQTSEKPKTTSKDIPDDITLLEEVITDVNVTKSPEFNETDGTPKIESAEEHTFSTELSISSTTSTPTTPDDEDDEFPEDYEGWENEFFPEEEEPFRKSSPILENKENSPLLSTDTLPDYEHIDAITESPESVDNIPVSATEESNSIPDYVEKISYGTQIVHEPHPTGAELHSAIQVNPEAATNSTVNVDDMKPEESLSPPNEIDDDFESRSLTEKPVVTIEIDENNENSTAPIEVDDLNEEDTRDTLTGENLLAQNGVTEITMGETSTPTPTTGVPNVDENEQNDGELISLIPIIIKQMKLGNVNKEEMEILQQSFGLFWPFIEEEARRDSSSSKQMNPLFREIMHSVKKRVTKREATVRRYRRPVFRGIHHFDKGYDSKRRMRYYNERRRLRLPHYIFV
ncbi:hypothetical protein Bhyg_02592 [Pseudolycoriella hygida]|uniref:Uncharacterized protein n=1 Tax=Pseudolycoriella hygida TaxID=35572 RepID=A0A9Q0NBP9_9DIPT|nr:hypothetical protein Bhyg_02592 [Pseudolycoriella hygida]